MSYTYNIGKYEVSNSSLNYLTDVGGYTSASSSYGTFDQGDNVWEWNEAVIGSSRGLRGGSWNNVEDVLRASFRNDIGPSLEGWNGGFRVADLFNAIPEPTVGGLVLLGGAFLWRRARR